MNTVRRTNIYLDEEQDRLLRHLSVEQGRSFTDIVREALNEYLERRGISSGSRVIGARRRLPDGEWQRRITEAVERIRASVPSDMTPAEIEAEITAAAEEVRRERLASGRY